jgi:hypothetical protein
MHAVRFGLTFVVCAVALSSEPVLAPADQRFLHEQARRIVDSAALRPGQGSGKYRNTTRYAVHVPGGNMGYPAFWVRDAVMMLGADFISPDELEGWIRLIGSTVRPAEWRVRPGVVVPAYAIPDHINFDGTPVFFPGTYDSGTAQGGPPFGNRPPLDDYFYFVEGLYRHWKISGSVGLFGSRVETASGPVKLADLCEEVYGAVPADTLTGLAVSGDVETDNAKDFGFCDSVSKSGRLLFTSILKFRAANMLSELFAASGDQIKAPRYREDAVRIRRAIPGAFFHASADGVRGWLHSATGVGNQPDVWGSAFAVWSGVVDEQVATKVSRALVQAYRERTAVQQGCVRHILTTDPRGGWQLSISKPGEYQNGGYWGTATGWYIAAMHRVDSKAASDMAREYVRFLRANLRPDGMTESWEWFNPDTGKRVNPLYVATVALPYISLRESGLVDGY